MRKTNSPLSILTLTLSSAGRADCLYCLVTRSRVIITARQCSGAQRSAATARAATSSPQRRDPARSSAWARSERFVRGRLGAVPGAGGLSWWVESRRSWAQRGRLRAGDGRAVPWAWSVGGGRRCRRWWSGVSRTEVRGTQVYSGSGHEARRHHLRRRHPSARVPAVGRSRRATTSPRRRRSARTSTCASGRQNRWPGQPRCSPVAVRWVSFIGLPTGPCVSSSAPAFGGGMHDRAHQAALSAG